MLAPLPYVLRHGGLPLHQDVRPHLPLGGGPFDQILASARCSGLLELVSRKSCAPVCLLLLSNLSCEVVSRGRRHRLARAAEFLPVRPKAVGAAAASA
jgi:hypothetical protein